MGHRRANGYRKVNGKGMGTGAAQSSARIACDGSAESVAFQLAGVACTGCGLPGTRDCRAHGPAIPHAAYCSFFARSETRRTHHTTNGQIHGLDLQLVLAHCHHGKCRFLLCGPLFPGVPCGTSARPQLEEGIPRGACLFMVLNSWALEINQAIGMKIVGDPTLPSVPPTHNQPTATNGRTNR
jgi:hypothetical protein